VLIHRSGGEETRKRSYGEYKEIENGAGLGKRLRNWSGSS